MKKFITLLLIFALTLIGASHVYAQPSQIPPAKRGDDRSEFRTRLSTIRDEKKKAIVDRTDKRIVEINLSRTNIMTRHIAKIEEVLNKIETRAIEVEKRGKDIGAVRAAIVTSRTAIASAKSAIAAQIAKTYTIDVTTEDKLGPAVSSPRTAFAKDLQAAHQSVVTARKSVRDVLKALAKVVGEKLPDAIEK
jgi:Mg2+ and Co2+ transporter CorA